MREELGRPSASDYVSSHLTFQNSHRAPVYSLVTKQKYFMKRNICDYDSAFGQMIDDFKKRGLKKDDFKKRGLKKLVYLLVVSETELIYTFSPSS